MYLQEWNSLIEKLSDSSIWDAMGMKQKNNFETIKLGNITRCCYKHLVSIYSAIGMFSRDLHKLILTTTQRDRDYYYYHFTGEKTERQRVWVICPSE